MTFLFQNLSDLSRMELYIFVPSIIAPGTSTPAKEFEILVSKKSGIIWPSLLVKNFNFEWEAPSILGSVMIL